MSPYSLRIEAAILTTKAFAGGSYGGWKNAVNIAFQSAKNAISHVGFAAP